MSNITFAAGMKLLRARNYQAVYEQSVEALRQDEKAPLAFFLLGVLASDTGSHEKALEFLAKASEHGPKNVHYQTYHAKALVTLGQNEQAKMRADIAAALGTNDALLADMIGVVYSRTGYHELAIPFFEKAVKKNPRWANFHFNLGASAEFVGDFEKAKTAYQNTLAVNPKFYLAWFSLIALETQKPDNHKLDTIATLFDGTVGDVEGQLLLGHAAAKTLEDLGRYAESYDWLQKAKQLKGQQVQYSRQETARVFEAAKATVRNNLSRSSSAVSTVSDTAPLFVVGLPRTGTTLVDRILSSHPQISSAGELSLFADLINAAVGAPPNTGFSADIFRAAGQVDLLNVGKIYTDNTRALGQGASHLIDKMPFNFLYAGLIQRALPNAKIIVLRRGAMDSCLSNYRQVFAGHNGLHDYAYNIEDMAGYYREFDGLITHWREAIPPDRFMEVAYEDIVRDQENQTRNLLSFCDLEWDEACMDFHKNTAPVATASAVQVRQPLYSGSIGRWKKYGEKLDDLRAALGDLAD